MKCIQLLKESGKGYSSYLLQNQADVAQENKAEVISKGEKDEPQPIQLIQ